jgi:succinoglycan biosynthesis protein ExoA
MEYPPVSAVMPVRNEERYLAESVARVLGQDYPGPLELVLAVGPSADRTEQIARELAAADPRVTVAANPTGQIPAALNVAVRAARHQVIARIDGHAMLPDAYLRTAVAELAQTGAADVGGVMAAEGLTPFQRAVAWSMTSKAGVGSAAFHTGGGAGQVDSVYLGVYRREAIEQAGGWDEGMLRAEDWDLNFRIRSGGGVIWFTPELRVTYRPRASVRTLASQYFHYGRWRRVIVREHPETASFRYLAPPGAAALVTAGLAAGVAGLAGLAAGAPAGVCWLAAGLVIPVTYVAGITAVGLALARRVPAGVRCRVPLVFGVMHMCWGAGFLTSPKRLHRGRGAAGRGAAGRGARGAEADARVGQPAAPGGREAVAGRE